MRRQEPNHIIHGVIIVHQYLEQAILQYHFATRYRSIYPISNYASIHFTHHTEQSGNLFKMNRHLYTRTGTPILTNAERLQQKSHK